MDYNLSDDEISRNSRWKRGFRPNGEHNSTNSTAIPSSTATSISTTNNDGNALGLSDPTLSEARRRKLDIINKLHSLGAQRDIDIPQIVVIGSQSAGKSSLIESISGITLPRASGTCTRCPTECQLIHSTAPWQCIVSLRFMTGESGQPLDPIRVVPFGPLIRDPKEVEDRLRRAQRAVLNPSIEPQRFLERTQPVTKNALNFSTNCVSLEIRGPEVTDLSFCDLPGLIASVSDNGRDEDVEEVKDLVASYIKKESCITLLTVTCETDFETQGAYRLAKQYDSKGTRTIGVLTKPDRIPEGEDALWTKLIKNETSVLQNGWYCVKQPSTMELERGLTFQEARRQGEDFFRNKPWSTLDPKFQKKLGTRALTQKLNEYLMTVISKRFPELMQELQAMLQQTKEDLQKLPLPVSKDPVLELMHLISDFSDDLFRQAEGLSNNVLQGNQFVPITKAQEAFWRTIRATAPDFRPFDKQGVGYSDSAVPTDMHEYAEEASYDSEREGTISYHPETPFLQSEEAANYKSSQDPIYLDDIVERVEKATTRELPGYFPFHVLQDLISCSTGRWEAPARILINEIHQVVYEQQNTLIQKYFAHYTEGGLRQTVTNIMQEYMQRRRDESVERVKWILELEANPFTLNKQYLDDYREKFLTFYKTKRNNHIGLNSVDASKPWNPNQSALEIMATVRAYFQLAYKRAVDTIPLAIDRELVRVQKRGVQDALSLGLKITGPEAYEHCQRLLAEPSDIVALRDELEHRLERLTAAQKELSAV